MSHRLPIKVWFVYMLILQKHYRHMQTKTLLELPKNITKFLLNVVFIVRWVFRYFWTHSRRFLAIIRISKIHQVTFYTFTFSAGCLLMCLCSTVSFGAFKVSSRMECRRFWPNSNLDGGVNSFPIRPVYQKAYMLFWVFCKVTSFLIITFGVLLPCDSNLVNMICCTLKYKVKLRNRTTFIIWTCIFD